MEIRNDGCSCCTCVYIFLPEKMSVNIKLSNWELEDVWNKVSPIEAIVIFYHRCKRKSVFIYEWETNYGSRSLMYYLSLP